MAAATPAASAAAHGSASTPKRSRTAAQAAAARSRRRELRRTAAPDSASMAAARCPTGPVPASTAARTPASGCAVSTVATAAAAVVLQPLASSIHGDPEVAEELLAHRGVHCLGASQVAAADQDRGVALPLGRAGVDRALHQRKAVVGIDPAAGQHRVRARVVRHHLIEGGRQQVSVSSSRRRFSHPDGDGARGPCGGIVPGGQSEARIPGTVV